MRRISSEIFKDSAAPPSPSPASLVVFHARRTVPGVPPVPAPWERLNAPPAASATLRALYQRLDDELSPWRRSCRGCGECCCFDRAEHTLFLTALEAVEMAAAGTTALAAAPSSVGTPSSPERKRRGPCPFMREHLCAAREHRALGCRLYFCDEKGEERRRELYEKYLKAIRDCERRHGVEHLYAPLEDFHFTAESLINKQSKQ